MCIETAVSQRVRRMLQGGYSAPMTTTAECLRSRQDKLCRMTALKLLKAAYFCFEVRNTGGTVEYTFIVLHPVFYGVEYFCFLFKVKLIFKKG